MTPSKPVAVIVGLILGIAVVTVNIFSAAIGALWVKEVTNVALLISLAFNIPIVQTSVAAIFNKKETSIEVIPN